MSDAETFINTVNDNYNVIKKELQSFCASTSQKFDPDIFQDTIIKCYDRINKTGSMKDTTKQGCKNYLFMSFKINLKREKQYCRNAKKDGNIENISELYELYSNLTKSTQEEKLLRDLYLDFSTLYIMKLVKQVFDDEHYHLFYLKTFEKGLTYRQLQEKTGIKAARQKVIEVKNFLKQSLTKDEIKEAFNKEFGNFLLN